MRYPWRVNDDQIIRRLKDAVSWWGIRRASAEDVAEVEAAVGYPMPPLLKRIYLEVADGGEGGCLLVLSLTEPEYCCDGDQGEHAEPLLSECLSWVESFPRHRLDRSPTLVPLTGGCDTWTLIDYSTPQGNIWSWESSRLSDEDLTFAEWLVAKLDEWDASAKRMSEPVDMADLPW
ncbi:hypothetical protein GCM10010439_66530 [Actinocorallia aurantiaca]|uniref:Knr4/Smi1-like domain-containing protein n=1 Tax=Actinocorallia aurantiaca TaxID=46204 RepID=A0ABN3UQY0_9ACTN